MKKRLYELVILYVFVTYSYFWNIFSVNSYNPRKYPYIYIILLYKHEQSSS